jgi:uncharacterized protein (TIGR03435 family)
MVTAERSVIGLEQISRSATRLVKVHMLSAIVLIVGLTAVTSWSAPLDAQTTTGQQAAPMQTSTAQQWETAAGGKMAFDVASVRQDKSETKPQSNVKLNNLREAYPPNGGTFTATNWPLLAYITFAYKLSDQQMYVMAKSLPDWVFTDRFDIEAKSENHNPTKDQMRLMLEALLEDRFKLVGRRETRQLPAFGLVLAKPGKTGLQLKQHSADSPCPAQEAVSSVRSAPVETILRAWPPNCNHTRATGDSRGIRLAGRNVSVGQLADSLTGSGELEDRVIVDQTGLTGTFDFVMDFAEEAEPSAGGEGGKIQADDPLPTLSDALRDQLGFKLVKQNAPIDCFLVVHVEHPSAN